MTKQESIIFVLKPWWYQFCHPEFSLCSIWQYIVIIHMFIFRTFANTVYAYCRSDTVYIFWLLELIIVWFMNCQENHRVQFCMYALFCPNNSPKPQIFCLQLHKTTKISKSFTSTETVKQLKWLQISSLSAASALIQFLLLCGEQMCCSVARRSSVWWLWLWLYINYYHYFIH